jgi:NAD(P)-dependent dehydrogenase (short-subunit alcohol dehydrogenase family)
MKNVFITGVSGGMGAATAKHFHDKGYRVFGTDIKQTELNFLVGFYLGNVTDEEMWAKVSSDIASQAGTLDALINIAGRNYFDEVGDAQLSQWRDMFEVNVLGMVASIKHLSPLLKKAQAAAIVNMSSISGYIGSHGYAAYCATKGAVDSLTKSLALELAPSVRVNAIAPGWIETPFTVAGLELSDDPVAYRRDVEAMHALNRVGTPEEIAKAIYWIASDDAGFMTGSVVIVDGGYMIKN